MGLGELTGDDEADGGHGRWQPWHFFSIHAIKLQIRTSMYLQNLHIRVFLHLDIKWYEFLNSKSWQDKCCSQLLFKKSDNIHRTSELAVYNYKANNLTLSHLIEINELTWEQNTKKTCRSINTVAKIVSRRPILTEHIYSLLIHWRTPIHGRNIIKQGG